MMAREVFRGTRQRLRPYWLLGFAVVCFAARASAQTLQISRQTSVAGEWAILEIAFQPAASSSLTALQWEMEIPATLQLDGAPLARVPLVVKDANKSINCAVSKKSAEGLLLPCILAGGIRPIPAGTVVLLSMKIGQSARPGTARIRLQNASGVTGDLKQVPIESAEAELTIRAK